MPLNEAVFEPSSKLLFLHKKRAPDALQGHSLTIDQCDEAKPRCSACARHGVSCEYAFIARSESSSSRQHDRTPPSDIPQHIRADSEPLDSSLDPKLELRLMHEWTAYVCQSFSTAWEFWRYQAPLIALEFRYMLDAMHALAALHASRQPTRQWVPLESRMVEIRTPSSAREQDRSDHWNFKDRNYEELLAHSLTSTGNNAFLASKHSAEMVNISRMYFDRAIDGHRKALSDLNMENIEAVYCTSVIVSIVALFTLSESEDDSMLMSVNPIQWLRLSRGTVYITSRWQEIIGPVWLGASGVFYGKEDTTQSDPSFDRENERPFGKLLTWAKDFEAMTAEDYEAYQKTLAYIGAIYKGIVDGTDTSLATCRRLVALPSRCPPRFVDLAEAKQPRALVMLSYVFATMKVTDTTTPWFRGIAERQVPKIYEELPHGWREMMAWPMAVARGEVKRQPTETFIDDILAL